MFKFWSELSLIGKIIVLLAILVIWCSIVSQCVICDYIPIRFVKNDEWDEKIKSLYIFGQKENFANQENFLNVENPKLIYFSSPHCSYCNSYNPVWEQLIIKLKENYPNVNFVKVNALENKQTTNEYGVKGFPTIIFETKDGQKITFEGDRNAIEEIKLFIDSKINN